MVSISKGFWSALALGSAAVLSLGAATSSFAQSDVRGKTVVLVHGAFADGSSWTKIIPILRKRGLQVIAVQNPLTSLEDDVAATRRAIERASGPVVLVGHSWGGVVITEAGNAEKVKALVYVAAFAPDSGQSIASMTADAPPPSYARFLKKDSGGFLTLSDEGIGKNFAQDLSPAEADLVAITQGPWASRCPTDKVTRAAWRSKPSWMVVAGADGMIPPVFQEAMGAAIKAKTIRVEASHVPMISKPDEVAGVIISAAQSVK